MLYIIGLGLNEKGISKQGLEIIKRCKKVYLENYTINFPYDLKDLELREKIIPLKRSEVESNKLINEAKSRDIALLVYGSPLFATTHMTLVKDAKEQRVRVRVIHSASIFDAISETGLQLYKFGKIISIPNFEAESFIDVIKENQSINAHSLILIDIDLSFNDAIDRLEKLMKKEKINVDKIIICEKLGTNKSRIYYDNIPKLKTLKIKSPFCFIIPGKLHFLEKEILEEL